MVSGHGGETFYCCPHCGKDTPHLRARLWELLSSRTNCRECGREMRLSSRWDKQQRELVGWGEPALGVGDGEITEVVIPGRTRCSKVCLWALRPGDCRWWRLGGRWL